MYATTSVRHYLAKIGTTELHFSAISDTQAVRIAARWVRLFWPAFAAKSPKGSIAEAVNMSPDVMCDVARYYWHPLCHAGVRGDGLSKIRSFCPEAAREQ